MRALLYLFLRMDLLLNASQKFPLSERMMKTQKMSLVYSSNMGRTYKNESFSTGKKNQAKKQIKKNREKGKDFSCVTYNRSESEYIEEVNYDEDDGFEKFTRSNNGKR